MKKIQKKLSVVLAVMMVLCMFTALPFSASAAETKAANKINVTSNVTDPVSYEYNSNTKQVVVTYYLQADNMILNTQGTLKYDSSVLKLASTTKKNASFPVFGDTIVWNKSSLGKVLFNCTSLDLYNFKQKAIYCTFTFDVVGSGDTTVDLDVQVLTGTKADSYEEFFDGKNIDISYINYDEERVAGATFTADATLVQVEEPTTEPTTVPATDPTQPSTEAPTTAPVTEPTQPSTEPTTPARTATVYFAAPRVAPGRTVWNDVDIYYNDTTSVIKSNRIHMVDTGLVVDNPNGAKLKTTRRGNWHVFSAELTADQVNAIDNAKYAGFVHAGNNNLKTSAKFDIKMSKSIADFDGQVFLINAAVTNSEVDSYTGEWTTAELTKPEYKATTLKFACPTQNWSGGVYFYYGSSSVITTVTKLEMKDSGQTLAVSDDLVSALTKYKGGDWKVYTIDLTAEQVELIDNSSVSGFCSGSSIYVKTSSARNVFRDYNSVSDLANYAFVATNCIKADQERASLTGKWRWCKL